MPVPDTKTLQDYDRDYVWHPFTQMREWEAEPPIVITRGEGSYLIDSDGKRYLDGIGGLWCVNIGYGNEEMAEAIADQARRMPYYSTFTHVTTPPAAKLAAKLAQLAPGTLNHVMYGARAAR